MCLISDCASLASSSLRRLSLSSGEMAGGGGGLIPGGVLGFLRGIGDLHRLLPPLENASSGVIGAGPTVGVVVGPSEPEP